MDSLAVSAIGLAAGGWKNVKLVGIYTRTTNVPSWKLGICQITQFSQGGLMINGNNGYSLTSVLAEPASIIIAPGNVVNMVTGLTNFSGSSIRFDTETAVFTTSTVDITRPGWCCAVLFTW